MSRPEIRNRPETVNWKRSKKLDKVLDRYCFLLLFHPAPYSINATMQWGIPYCRKKPSLTIVSYLLKRIFIRTKRQDEMSLLRWSTQAPSLFSYSQHMFHFSRINVFFMFSLRCNHVRDGSSSRKNRNASKWKRYEFRGENRFHLLYFLHRSTMSQWLFTFSKVTKGMKHFFLSFFFKHSKLCFSSAINSHQITPTQQSTPVFLAKWKQSISPSFL